MPPRQPSESRTILRPRTTSAPSSFPQALANYVPKCAQDCLSTYISQQFDCSDGDVSCLCSEYGRSGFTLGELALVCVTLECPSASTEDSASASAKAYSVCSAQTDAASATQRTLSPPATSSTLISSTATTTVSTFATTSTTSSTATQSIDTASVVTPSAAAETKSGRTALTSGQAIGISVGAVGFVLIAVGFFYILACSRRRKRKAALKATQRHSYDFVDDASAQGADFQHSFTHYQKPAVGLNITSGALDSSEKRTTHWPTLPTQPQPYYRHEKKISHDRQTRRSDSPESYRSGSSMRTTSQLLPEKPSGLLLRPPPRSPELSSMRTPATIFEEDRFSAHIAPPVPSLPKNPRQPQYAYQFTKPAEHTKQPSLTLDIPIQAPNAQPVKVMGAYPAAQQTVFQPAMAHPPALMPGQSMPTFPPPPKSSQSVPVFAPPPVSTTRPIYERSTYGDSSSNSVLDYYASPEGDSPTDLYSSTPIEDETQVRRAAPAAIAISKPSYPPMAVRASMASDVSRRTSFESTDPDEPTPPEEDDKRLTPVEEAASPIADIRYPKIPRSANQSVPRSPPSQYTHRFPTRMDSQVDNRQPYNMQHNRGLDLRDRERGHTATSSSSSLAAKRRGDGAANKLHITTITSNSAVRAPPTKDSMAAYMREAPLKGYGRAANSAGSTPDWPLKIEMRTPGGAGGMKSPLWEPKLTPRREGDDLYLSVSIATPQHAHFPRR